MSLYSIFLFRYIICFSCYFDCKDTDFYLKNKNNFPIQRKNVFLQKNSAMLNMANINGDSINAYQWKRK